MSNIIIVTQYTENYGAFDWDGAGACPQNWKMKGGDAYIIPNSKSEVIREDLDKVLRFIESSNQVTKEHIVHVLESEILPDMDSNPWILRRNGYGVWIAEREDASYIMKPNGKREDYHSYGEALCSH